MTNSIDHYDWCIIGGGITGVACAELLSRENDSVIIVEKNEKLVAETSAEFHEWFHLGSLYTIKKDNNNTIKTLLNSFKKMNEFYSEYKNFNIELKDKGFEIKKFDTKKEWFNDDKLEIRYSINENKKDFKWIKMVARSIMIIKKIKEIQWIKKDQLKPFKHSLLSLISGTKIFIKLLKSKKSYYAIKSEDFSFNSRNMIYDLLSNAINNNLKLSLGNKFIKMAFKKNKDSFYEINCSKKKIFAKKVIFCNGRSISEVFSSQIKTYYAPMIVYKNYNKNNSYFEISNDESKANNCIVKENDTAVVGGASYSDLEIANQEKKKLHELFIKENPEVEKKLDYIGLKNEFIAYETERNYLYHIWKKKNQDIWAIIPGKFTLAFSAAIDFYRSYFKNDPIKENYYKKNKIDVSEHVSEIKWKEI